MPIFCQHGRFSLIYPLNFKFFWPGLEPKLPPLFQEMKMDP